MVQRQGSHTKKSSRQNVSQLSHGKALPARHSPKRQPGTTLQLPVMCSSRGSFAAQLLANFLRNYLILHLSLSLHQLNTKPNTIKSYKVQGYKLKQLQHFLSWNKANIKHSYKSQLYNLQETTYQIGLNKVSYITIRIRTSVKGCPEISIKDICQNHQLKGHLSRPPQQQKTIQSNIISENQLHSEATRTRAKGIIIHVPI